MHTEFDPYAELGVARDATPAQINSAFRRLLRRYHPDTRGVPGTRAGADCDSALQRVLAAYTALREARETSDRRPETTAARVDLRPSRAEVPIRAGPIHWMRDTRR
jgi:DnaJ-class molecular chaperone